jgi:hypothetical protein
MGLTVGSATATYESGQGKEDKSPRFEAKAVPVVFLGLFTMLNRGGGKWEGDYLVANLADFRAEKLN